MQSLGAFACRHAFEPASQRFVATGAFEEAACQRPIVEARATDENRKLASSGDVPDDRRRLAGVARRRVLLDRAGHVDHVMRNAALLAERDLVGADVEAAVDRRRVAADDFPIPAFGERDAERTLPRRRRSDDCDETRLAGVQGTGTNESGIRH